MSDLQLEWAVRVGAGKGEKTIRKRKLPLVRSKVLIPFDHEQYVKADKQQIRSKVPCHNFFHKNQHLKYQAFSKGSWEHGQ